MAISIGFAVLSHNHPEQLLRLATTLTSMFNAPPIVCHHDLAQCALHTKIFPSNLSFVTPHINTRWGHISQPLAALRCFQLLKSTADPDWVVLLSGSDYPVCPAPQILNDLEKTEYDAFLDHREIQYSKVPRWQNEQHGFNRPDWVNIAYNRYCAVEFWAPLPTRDLFRFRRRRFAIRSPKVVKLLAALRNTPKIYAGDFWFQANKKAISRLLGSSSSKIINYYYNRAHPDEALFQTALCNQTDLKICAQHRRYSDWTEGGAHPKWLEVSDLPLILASQAHFARKFKADGAVQDFVDKTVLGL
jgi:hypothetical protein